MDINKKKAIDGTMVNVITNDFIRNFENLNLIIEHLADTVWVTNQDGVIQDVNHKAVMEIGYTLDELLGMQIEDFDLTIKKIGFKKYFKSVLDKGVAFYEGERIHKNGEIINIQASGTVIKIDSKLIYISTTRNSTENKHKEDLSEIKNKLSDKIKELKKINEELIKSENRNRAILNLVSGLIFKCDVDGNFIDCITNEIAILNLPKAKFQEENLSETIPIEIAEKVKEYIKKSNVNNQIQRFKYERVINNEKKCLEICIIKSSENEVFASVREIT